MSLNVNCIAPSQENIYQNTGFFNSETLSKELFMVMMMVVVVAELCAPQLHMFRT